MLYRIKPLEWKASPGGREFVALTLIGNFIVRRSDHGTWWYFYTRDGSECDGFKTAQDAQTVAEQCFCEQLSRHLTPAV
jgi:hypothetical protein